MLIVMSLQYRLYVVGAISEVCGTDLFELSFESCVEFKVHYIVYIKFICIPLNSHNHIIRIDISPLVTKHILCPEV